MTREQKKKLPKCFFFFFIYATDRIYLPVTHCRFCCAGRRPRKNGGIDDDVHAAERMQERRAVARDQRNVHVRARILRRSVLGQRVRPVLRERVVFRDGGRTRDLPVLGAGPGRRSVRTTTAVTVRVRVSERWILRGSRAGRRGAVSLRYRLRGQRVSVREAMVRGDVRGVLQARLFVGFGVRRLWVSMCVCVCVTAASVVFKRVVYVPKWSRKTKVRFFFIIIHKIKQCKIV